MPMPQPPPPGPDATPEQRAAWDAWVQEQQAIQAKQAQDPFNQQKNIAASWLGGRDNMDRMTAHFGGPDAPPPQLETAEQAQEREQQQALIKSLQDQAAGRGGPSLAQGQLQQATDANMKHAMALAQTQQGQGMGYGAALRGVADEQANIGQQAAGQSSQLRSMEQIQAQGQLAGLLGQTRGQDQSVAGNKAQLDFAYAQLAQAKDAATKQMWGSIISGLGGGLISGVGSGLFGKGGGGGTGGGSSGGGSSGGNGGMMQAASGGLVPGDDPRNDVVPAMLSPGEVVLPRSVTQSDDPARRAAEFIEAIKRQKRSGQPQ